MLITRFARLISVFAIATVFALGLGPAGVSQAAPLDDNTQVWRGYSGSAFVGVRVGANVRSCASTHCHRVGGLRYGARVWVQFTQGGWSYIGHGRWIANYLLVAC